MIIHPATSISAKSKNVLIQVILKRPKGRILDTASGGRRIASLVCPDLARRPATFIGRSCHWDESLLKLLSRERESLSFNQE